MIPLLPISEYVRHIACTCLRAGCLYPTPSPQNSLLNEFSTSLVWERTLIFKDGADKVQGMRLPLSLSDAIGALPISEEINPKQFIEVSDGMLYSH